MSDKGFVSKRTSRTSKEPTPEQRLRLYIDTLDEFLSRFDLDRDKLRSLESETDPVKHKSALLKHAQSYLRSKPFELADFRYTTVFEAMAEKSRDVGHEIDDEWWRRIRDLSAFPDNSRPAFAALIYFTRAYIDWDPAPIALDPFKLRNIANEAVDAIDQLMNDKRSLHFLFNKIDPEIRADRSVAELRTRPAIRELMVALVVLRKLSTQLNSDFESYKANKKRKRGYAPYAFVKFLNVFSEEYRGRRLSRNKDNFNDGEWVALICRLIAPYGAGQIRLAMEKVIRDSINDSKAERRNRR